MGGTVLSGREQAWRRRGTAGEAVQLLEAGGKALRYRE